MNQSNFIAGAIFVTFLIYITTKGELRRYLGFFGLASGTSGTATSASPAGTVSTVINSITGTNTQTGKDQSFNY